MKLTKRSLAAETNQIGGTIEEMRFKLARLAARAKREGVPDWDKIIGNGRAVRRSERTVRDWALTAEFCQDLPKQYNLPYSFFSIARRYADKMAEGDLIDMLDTAENDRTINLEAFGATLNDVAPKTPKPEPAATSLHEDLLAGAAVVEDIRKRSDLTPWVAAYMESAANQFENALRRLELEPAPDAEGERA